MPRLRLISVSISVRRHLLLPSPSTLTASTADDKYIFTNETERYVLGQVAKGPAIRSDAAREWASDNITAVMETEGEWICAAATDSALRLSLGLETYRYLWAGKFELSSLPPK